MSVSAVIVAYNSSAVIGTCLESLGGIDDIVVVDNSADDALAARPGIRYIRNARNEGFGRGNNTGVSAAKHDLVLLLNPDAALEPGALDVLLRAAEAYPDAAILTPTILKPDGSLETRHDADLFQGRAMPRRRTDPEPEGDLCAGFLSGAAMLIRRKAFLAIGGFDPSIFLFYEDNDLCLRLRRAGHALVHVNAARVRHIGGGSSSFSYARLWRKEWHFAWSRLYIERKFNGTGAAWSEGLPLALKHGSKGLLYGLTMQRRKAVRDLARAAGHAAFLLGLTAQSKE